MVSNSRLGQARGLRQKADIATTTTQRSKDFCGRAARSNDRYGRSKALTENYGETQPTVVKGGGGKASLLELMENSRNPRCQSFHRSCAVGEQDVLADARQDGVPSRRDADLPESADVESIEPTGVANHESVGVEPDECGFTEWPWCKVAMDECVCNDLPHRLGGPFRNRYNVPSRIRPDGRSARPGYPRGGVIKHS
jgi:hypothetical protein